MRILGIDPGTKKSGWAVWDTTKQLIVDMGIDKNSCVILTIYNNRHCVDQVVIEEIRSYGKRVGNETFETCWWSGRFYEAADTLYDGHTTMLPRLDAKIYLLGNAKATDADVSSRIRQMYGEKGTKKNPGVFFGVKSHIWNALAVIFAWMRKSEAGTFVMTPEISRQSEI